MFTNNWPGVYFNRNKRLFGVNNNNNNEFIWIELVKKLLNMTDTDDSLALSSLSDKTFEHLLFLKANEWQQVVFFANA